MNRIVAALLAAALALAGPLPARADGTAAPRSAVAEPPATPVPTATEPREAGWPALLGLGGTVGGIVTGFYLSWGFFEQLQARKHCGIAFGCEGYVDRAAERETRLDLCQCCENSELLGLMRLLEDQEVDFGIMDMSVPPLQRMMVLRDFAYLLSMSTTGEFKAPSFKTLVENDVNVAGVMLRFRETVSHLCHAALDRKWRDLDDRLAREGR